MEHPIKMDDLGVPLFVETSKSNINPPLTTFLVDIGIWTAHWKPASQGILRSMSLNLS